MNYKEKINSIMSLMNKGLFEKAISELNLCLSQDIKTEEVYYLIGSANIYLGKLKDAIKYFKLVINYNSKNFLAYNNLGIVYTQIGMFKEAISNFSKSIKINSSYFEGYNNLGGAYLENGDIDKAIDSFIKSLDIKPDFFNAYDNLIRSLTVKNYSQKTSNIFIKTHNKLQKVKFNFDVTKKIDDFAIKAVFQKSNKIINKDLHNLTFNSSQIYRNNKVDLNCNRHFKIFNTFNIIPENCFECYKILVSPQNVLDLIKLYFLFDKIILPKNNNRKCMIEMRPEISGNYKGYIYCRGFKDANMILKQINNTAKIAVNKNIKLEIKRGCSEFAIAYPDYKKISERSKNFMNYNPNWKNKENEIDEKFSYLIKSERKETLPGIALNDILIIRNWIAYANLLGDFSYKKIVNTSFTSQFIEKRLAGQVEYRQKELI